MSSTLSGRGGARLARFGQILPQGEPVGLADIRDALVIKESDLFLMTDAEGNLPRENNSGYGLYKGDTRHLSVYDLSFDRVRPTVLLSSAELGYSSEHHLTNPHMPSIDQQLIPKDSLEIRRQRVINRVLLETIHITNFSISEVTFNLRFEFEADFVDIFEVRGHKRRRRGKISTPVVEKDKVRSKYHGLDNVWRSTEIKFSPQPDQIWYNGALFTVTLGHRDTAVITVTVSPDDAVSGSHFQGAFEMLAASYADWLSSCTQVFTDNEFFNAILERSLKDARMLTVGDDGGAFIAAGTPWFNCLFGRDSIIASLQLLAFRPDMARGTLRMLARWQGKDVDDWRDQEPGKILHELRVGEMASVGEIPMTPYYGAVDSTLLFLMLVAEYVAWTGDLGLVRELEPNLMSALEWVQKFGDADGCGYVEYSRRSPQGLLNQAWKDSRDSIVNENGTLAKPPISVVEVQGYAYAAKNGMAWLLSLLGKPRLARMLRREATDLKVRFNRDFWMEDEGFCALALGAGREPARSIASNPGQCLWTGIVDEGKSTRLVERLFWNDLFSGWGIRTMSSRSVRYNPLSYHLGSVWPHDNSLIGMGLKRYGFDEELDDLATALYDCCRSFAYYRLPELFCGVPRTSHNLPVRYPVACRPQAWAAGTFPLLLQAILGLAPNAARNELRVVHPRLPHWLRQVEVRGLRVGSGAVDLLYESRRGRTQLSVLAERGVRVVLSRKWPGQKSRY